MSALQTLSCPCAGLNPWFVDLCRSCSVTARVEPGLRLAQLAFAVCKLEASSANLKSAQYAHAEVWRSDLGWVAMDPADVLKDKWQKTPEWIKKTIVDTEMQDA